MSFDLDRYFDRIGWKPGNESSLEILRLIHYHHITKIPFENIDVFNKQTVKVDPDSVFEKIVLKKRGGYCFEQNCLLYTALEKMGFGVKPYSARIKAGDMGYGPCTHQINIAELDGIRYILDVGFGGNCFVYPLILEEGLEQQQLWMRYRVVHSETVDYAIQIMTDGVYTDMLGFNDKPALPKDFEMGNFYTNMHPTSYFRDHIMCAIYTENGKNTLFDNHLTIRENDVITYKTLERDELVPALRQYFCLDAEGLI
ncbi:MAG: arylamine N-acetyltransferase [Clostridiales bacterium]|nr:arylamine N-acetyltransferase [Clostridiales bacterium]